MKVLLTILLLFGFSALTLEANEGMVFFEKKIRPVLEKYCYRCHSDRDKKIRGGLLVDTKTGLLNGGDSGPAVVPGNLNDSLLWESINHFDLEMPKKKMPQNIIDDFKKWILIGAPDPRVRKNVLVKGRVTEKDIEKGRKFWSFTKPRYSKVPKVDNSNWSKTEIDSYIYTGLQKAGLTAAAPTTSSVLLRRVYQDLIGLPPTPQQLISFSKSYKQNKDGALSEVVEDLLRSSHFGERWGRHWLDVARYAESTGRELNSTYPNAWRYRDYVIDSFNADKPYDQFIQEQIAGDLLKVKTDEEWAENLVATGFLALGPKTLTDQDNRQFKADLIDEQIDVVTRGIMGVSVSCARCHDHKFDPIPQSDYYALAGIFLSSKTYYGTVETQQNRHRSSLIRLPVRDVDTVGKLISSSEIASMKKQLTAANEELRDAQRARREMRMNPSANAGKSTQSSLRNFLQAQRKVSSLNEKINSVDSSGRPLSFCMGVQPGTVMNANILERGEVGKAGQEIPRGGIQVLSSETLRISSKSNGRKELAEWITSRENPLTARVMVNRIWLNLIGEGLVRSPENFGTSGKAPTHPELLDYLAVTFMDNNWSVKSMIREITLSRTYRMSSTFNVKNFKKDPDNKHLWNISRKRLDAEQIRDAILQISGDLIIKAPKGSIVAKDGHTVVALKARREESPYEINDKIRSVYLPVVRDMLPAMLKTFDFGESMLTDSQRESNNTAAQALFLLNNNFVVNQSDRLAKKLLKEFKKTDDQIKQAFLLCYSRPARNDELYAAKRLFSSFRSSSEFKKKSAATRAFIPLSAVCQALFASAEFRYKN